MEEGERTMEVVLDAQIRTDFHQSTLHQLRSEGYVPAVIYGPNVENTHIYFEERDLVKTIQNVGRNGVFSIKADGTEYSVMLSDYQHDFLKNEIIHADFLVVNQDTNVTTDVRVDLVGEAAGVNDGGVLQQPIHELSVTGKPGQVPDSININVENLQVGETITVGDVNQQYGFTINHDDGETIASILPPRQEKEISTGEEQEIGIPTNLEGRETNELEAKEQDS
jgi:large subunit ribosomal protein L25